MSLKSLFIKEDFTPTMPTASVPVFIAPQQMFAVPTLGVISGVDPEIKADLLQSLEDNKLSGFDYLKFLTSLEEAKSLSPTEEGRFKIAFIGAKTVGVNKTKLVESANHYLDVLKQDLSDFNANLTAKQKEVIGNNEIRLNEITKTVSALQTQLTTLQQEQSNLSSQISENKVKLENKKSAFETTHSSVVNDIKNNIDLINKYL